VTQEEFSLSHALLLLLCGAASSCRRHTPGGVTDYPAFWLDSISASFIPPAVLLQLLIAMGRRRQVGWRYQQVPDRLGTFAADYLGLTTCDVTQLRHNLISLFAVSDLSHLHLQVTNFSKLPTQLLFSYCRSHSLIKIIKIKKIIWESTKLLLLVTM